jgi:hypothetical protein
MTPALEEALRLLCLAHRDRTTLMLLARIPEAPMTSLGFHAQQALEKALKAATVSRGNETRRTRDLVALAQELLDDVGVTPLTLDEVRQLNPFAVEYRYDDEVVLPHEGMLPVGWLSFRLHPYLFLQWSKAVGMWSKAAAVGNAAAQRRVVHGRRRCAAGASSTYSQSQRRSSIS